jgi:prepilin-type N-terminal cleavage/methylation domain-containing protein
MRRAFTLVEIMVVILILTVLIAISVPNILRSRVVANEGVAMANLKTLGTACQAYHIDQQAYPDSLQILATTKPVYIDNVFGSGKKQGYEFIYESSDPDHFSVHANPIHTGLLKGRYFYTDEGGTIRSRSDGPAGPDDQIIS